ncbi:MAG: hypothetical protein ACRDVE_21585 [Actinocrinis sp.]
MAGMTVQEIWTALAENGGTPNGPVKIARAEYLVDAAEAAGEPPLYAQALIDVIGAYEYGAEAPKMLVPFARLLKLWDADAGAFDAQRRHSLFWYFKWATSGMASVPEVPLASIDGWLTEMASRYRQAGHSPRAVHMGRYRLARAAGDAEAAEREFGAWLDAPRDVMADCNACEAGSQGQWHAATDRDEQALRLWAPVLGGELVCAEEPHRVLSYSLLPLVRLGRLDEARANHLRGYRMARGVTNLRSTIARHIEFCALTGNEARGLEILTEHAAYLDSGAEDADTRLDFAVGALVLLRRLIAAGLGGLDLGAGFAGLEQDAAPGGADMTVTRAADLAQARIDALCARFDARNGNATVSERVKERITREPLAASLPLGSPTTLPSVQRQAKPPVTVDAATPGGSGFDELVAEARRQTALRHPHARKAWERVAFSGVELPEDIAAHVDRSRAQALMEQDPAAARVAYQQVAERFERLGDQVEARQARSHAAFGAFASGDRESAETQAVVIAAEAEAAYASGDLTARQYLDVRSLSAYVAFNHYAELMQQAAGAKEQNADAPSPERTADASADVSVDTAPPDAESVARVIADELDLCDRLGDPGRGGAYCRMLAQLAFMRDDPDEARDHLEASHERYLAGGQPWDAAEPESVLAQMALRAHDPAAAELYARASIRNAGDTVRPEAAAQLGSLLVEAIAQQRDRQLDLVDAALRAAERWDGLSEPDTLHNRFVAARAYLELKRYAEAAALFDELMPRVHVPYDNGGIAMTREQYGDCLSELGEHRKAAEQYLQAAAIVQDDPQNQGPHARLAWSAAQALQNAGQGEDALPAFQRAAELWGTLGNVIARARCLRSAAWLIGWLGSNGGTEQSPAAWTAAVDAMLAVAEELRAIPQERRDEAVEAESANTEHQLSELRQCLNEALEAAVAEQDGHE